jgi:surface polysaccharide O-acyltransferase-like enzyme
MRIWSLACEMAAQTPQDRNRYVDFLRSISILIVITGHWLITTAYYADGSLTSEHLFKIQPLTQWLTWLFQVMPVFFIVGGYSNAVSIESAHRKGVSYPKWLAVRLHRLVTPLLVLLLVWASIAVVMNFFDVSPSVIQLASRASLIPTWFLAIYIMVVILAPLMYKAWKRLGFVSFWMLVTMAILMDIAYFALELRWLAWSNYFWVWLAIHSLGFAWRDGRMGSARQLVTYSMLALLAMWAMVFYGPYPLAMVGSPDQAVSNTTPPKITLLALGMFQFGLLLAVENPMRRALMGLRLWSATVLINSMIMTVYLWHLTLMILFIGLLYLLGGPGLGLEPGTLYWWFSRPLWIAILALLLVPVSLLLSPLERISRSPNATTASAPRQVTGAMMICLGVALLAQFGYGGGPFPGLAFAAFALVALGAGTCGLLACFK